MHRLFMRLTTGQVSLYGMVGCNNPIIKGEPLINVTSFMAQLLDLFALSTTFVYAHKIGPMSYFAGLQNFISFDISYPHCSLPNLHCDESLFHTEVHVFIKFCNQNNRQWYLVHIIRNFQMTPKQNGTQDKTQFLFWLSFVL